MVQRRQRQLGAEIATMRRESDAKAEALIKALTRMPSLVERPLVYCLYSRGDTRWEGESDVIHLEYWILID